MEIHKLAPGLEVEIELRPTENGYAIIHRQNGRGSYTVTCCCEGKGCVSTTCTYPDGTPPSPLCDCTGSAPSITC